MKSLKLLSQLLSLFALLLISAASAWADHGRTRIGVGMYFGSPVPPWYYAPRPYYYYPPYYYQPQVVVVPAAPPPVYIEQGSPGVPPAVAPSASPTPPPPPPPPLAENQSNPPVPKADNYWYYCRNSQAYYPYVRDCPEGWEQVTPR